MAIWPWLKRAETLDWMELDLDSWSLWLASPFTVDPHDSRFCIWARLFLLVLLWLFGRWIINWIAATVSASLRQRQLQKTRQKLSRLLRLNEEAGSCWCRPCWFSWYFHSVSKIGDGTSTESTIYSGFSHFNDFTWLFGWRDFQPFPCLTTIWGCDRLSQSRSRPNWWRGLRMDVTLKVKQLIW